MGWAQEVRVPEPRRLAPPEDTRAPLEHRCVTATSVFAVSPWAASCEVAALSVSASLAMRGPPASGERGGRGPERQVRVQPGQLTLPSSRCAPGFFGNPLVLGSSCQPCDCSGNGDPNMLFSDCDPLTGACRGCLRHTTGPRCESCAPGFYGNALLPGNCTRRRAGQGWGAGCSPEQAMSPAGPRALVWTREERGRQGKGQVWELHLGRGDPCGVQGGLPRG